MTEECRISPLSERLTFAANRFAVTTVAAITVVLLVASFVGTPVPGTNEPHYLSKARATADPDWCSNDFFLQSANAHAVFFALVGPLATSLPFAVVLVIGRIVSLLIVALGLRALCRAVGCDGPRAIIAAGLFFLIGLTGNFSGEWVIGGFESKVGAYGFAFLSLARCIDNRLAPSSKGRSIKGRGVGDDRIGADRIGGYIIAGVFAGLAIALHPVVGMWTLISISMTEAWLWIRPPKASDVSLRGLGSLLRRGIAFVVSSIIVALPGLLPAFRMLLSSTVDSETKLEAKQIQVFYRLAHHLDPTRFPPAAWWHTAALIGLCTLTAFVIRSRSGRAASGDEQCIGDEQGTLAGHNVPPSDLPPSGSWPSDSWPSGSSASGSSASGLRRQYLLLVLTCSAVIALSGVALGWHEEGPLKMPGRHWRAALLQFYPFRLFDALLPLTTAILFASIPRKRRSAAETSTASSTPSSTGQKVSFVDFLDNHSLRSVIGVAVIMTLICGAAALAVRPPSPSAYSAATLVEWKTACAWLKENSPPDAIVFAPRESFGLKLYAERAEFVCFKDCPQDAEGIVEWNRRLWLLHNWSKKSYADKLFSRTELAALNARTGIQYILTRRLGPFETKPVWKGKVWSIYAIGR